MLYRKMPRIEEKLSILGFGAMRLPVNADGSVDDKTVDVMMRKAIEGGGLYVGDDKVTDADARATLEQLQAGLILRRGKKSYHRVLLAP